MEKNNRQDDPTDERVDELKARRPTAEELYYQEQSYKEPVEGIGRIEEAAKFLIGATATTSGLFLAAFKLGHGEATVTDRLWYAPFFCWGLSIAALILVLVPQTYETGKNEPASWKKAFLSARKRKFNRLAIGAFFFVLGLLSAICPFL